jgi:CTP:molybdopterin cytidylyltransferase MocA
MTVAAIIVATDRSDALADAAGRSAVRRIVEVAWAGGCLPVVIVTDDPDGGISVALAGTPALIAVPPAGDGGAAALALQGVRFAREAVLETDALLLWPMPMTWVDPETVTSLLEGHGAWPDAVLRPAWRSTAGWPALVPVASLDSVLGEGTGGGSLAAHLDSAPVRAETRLLDLGDPGSVHDRSVPLDALPEYEGPATPVSGPPPEWGAAAAERPPDDEGLVAS